MDNIIVRIVLITLALVGVYKIFPQVSRPVDYYLKNPQFQSSVIIPAVAMANKVLPDKIQIPTPAVMGATTDSFDEAPLKAITEEISRQAASVAASLVEKSSQAVSNQFCNALLEKIKSECNK